MLSQDCLQQDAHFQQSSTKMGNIKEILKEALKLK